MTDAELLAEWHKDRGNADEPISCVDEAIILRALRARHEEQQNPKPLAYCILCGTKARGEHHESQVSK